MNRTDSIRCILTALFLYSSSASAEIKKLPTAPPSTPGGIESLLISGTYMRFKSDDIKLVSYGGELYSTFKNSGLGFSAAYMTGDMEFENISSKGNIRGWDMNINGDLAGMMLGDYESSYFMIHAGGTVSYSSTNTELGYENFESKTQMNILSFGGKAGVKAGIGFGESFRVIPFYLFTGIRNRLSASTKTDTGGAPVPDSNFDESYTVLSHLIGFDIEIMNISIGGIFDIFKKSDEKMFFFRIGYRFHTEDEGTDY